ncbi:hypothetical protein ScPMuIL_017242 [Solemya velum]
MQSVKTVVSIIIVVVTSNALELPIDFESGLEEPVQVDISNRMRDIDFVEDPLPEQMKIRLRWASEIIIMNLFRNPNITTNTPVYVKQNGAIHKQILPTNNNDGIYNNKLYGASFHLSFERRGGSYIYTVCGIFVWKMRQEMLVRPVGKLGHRLSTIHWNSSDAGGYIIAGNHVPLVVRGDPRSTDSEGGEDYTVELLFVVDFSIYQLWFQETRSESAQRDIDVKRSLCQYYALIFSQIDMRLHAINDDEFSLRSVLVGIYISDQSSASDWTQSESSTTSLPSTQNAENSLNDFGSWLSTEPGLPRHDHAIGFTALDLVRTVGVEYPVPTAGISNLGGICTVYSQSVISDSFNLKISWITARQIAHSFGVDHDGQGTRCQNQFGFAMDKTMKGNGWDYSHCSQLAFFTQLYLLNSNGYNCLVTANTSFYPLYEEEVRSSRLPRAASGSEDKYCAETTGEAKSVVCREQYADGYEKICSVMMCYSPSANKDKYGKMDMKCKPVEGMSEAVCGKSKWCKEKKCVDRNVTMYNYRPDGCPLGDQPGIVYRMYDRRNRLMDAKCGDLVYQEPSLCYYSHIEKRCCETCALVAKKNHRCRYGDIGHCTQDMCKTTMFPNGKSWRCCETCKSYITGATRLELIKKRACNGDSPGKVYGYEKPLLLWTCAEGVKIDSTLCYTQHEKCCASCKRVEERADNLVRGIHDCKYLDKTLLCWPDTCKTMSAMMKSECCYTCSWNAMIHQVQSGIVGAMSDCSMDSGEYIAALPTGQKCDWLDDKSKHYCYIQAVNQDCCKSCQRLRLPLLDCEFGDRSFNCVEDFCHEDHLYKRQMCCETCMKYRSPIAIPFEKHDRNGRRVQCVSVYFPGHPVKIEDTSGKRTSRT